MKKMMLLFLAMAVAVAGLALSGCGTAKSATTAPAPQSAPQAAPVPAAPDFSKYLTVADVEKVSGISGIKLMPKNPNVGAGGDLNFATADGNLVLMAGFHDVSMYNKYSPDTYHSSVKGIGEEGFVGPKQGNHYIIGFRKAQHSIVLNTFFKFDGKPGDTMLTMDQLKQLAKIVEGRL